MLSESWPVNQRSWLPASDNAQRSRTRWTTSVGAVVLFFFSSRRRHTRSDRDWSSDVCSSDLHVMIPYGQSLYIDDANHIPAQHFQNHRVPVDMACYSCHADYGLYGPLNDKMRGLERIYLQYVSTPPDPASIRIPGGFKNAQCLHCHSGARSFEENPVHAAM